MRTISSIHTSSESEWARLARSPTGTPWMPYRRSVAMGLNHWAR